MGRDPLPLPTEVDTIVTNTPLAIVLACQEASTPTLQPGSSKVLPPPPRPILYRVPKPNSPLHRPLKSEDTSTLLSPLGPHCCPFSCCSRERTVSTPPFHCQVPTRPLWPCVHLKVAWQSLGSSPLPTLYETLVKSVLLHRLQCLNSKMKVA